MESCRAFRLITARLKYFWRSAHINWSRQAPDYTSFKQDLERQFTIAEEKELVTAEFVQALIGQGSRCTDQGKYPRAPAIFHSTQSIGEQIGDQFGIAGALNGAGYIHHSQGDYVQALEAYYRGQPVEGGIGQHTRSDAQISPAFKGPGEREDDEGRSFAAGGPEADEGSGHQSPVLLSWVRADWRRLMTEPAAERRRHCLEWSHGQAYRVLYTMTTLSMMKSSMSPPPPPLELRDSTCSTLFAGFN